MNKNDCSAGLVKLDLDEMIKVCGYAIKNAKIEMERQKRQIEEHLFQASRSDTPRDSQFRHLCNANTETDYFKRSSKEYADSVSQYFYLVEAKNREDIQIIR